MPFYSTNTCQHFIYQSQNILNCILFENITQNMNKHTNISRTILPHNEVEFSTRENNQTPNRKSNLLQIKIETK